jgi:chemotaxis protein CheD
LPPAIDGKYEWYNLEVRVKYVVGVGDMQVTAGAQDVIVTYALGSCLGITIHDPVAHVGGMLHVMLPLSTIDPNKARENPCMFVDTGVPKLFLESYRLGASKSRLTVKVAGGASATGNGNDDYFNIGKRNITMLRQLLWKNGVLLKSWDVGGNESRTLTLDINNGEVSIRSNGKIKNL